MGISLSLISGKGGSGKTTIGLSISQMLAACNKKILYVDCDMSTHGATYFFEPFLNDKKKVATTMEMFFNGYCKVVSHLEKKELNVAKNIDFIPSAVEFSQPFVENEDLTLDLEQFKKLKNTYDLIIFDCQAGYSYVTDRILGVTDYNLVVTEEDAISASSIRVLHAQLAKKLDNSKTYQVFNKLSKADYEVYKKITNGTLFTNLTPVMFDWSVKRAFATHNLPEIDESNPILTENIYKLLCDIFPVFKKDLEKYIINVKINLLKGIERDLEKQKQKKKSITENRNFTRVLCYLTMILAAICLIFLLVFSDMDKDLTKYMVLIVIGVELIFIVLERMVGKITKEEWVELDKYDDMFNKSKRLQREIADLRKKTQ